MLNDSPLTTSGSRTPLGRREAIANGVLLGTGALLVDPGASRTQAQSGRTFAIFDAREYGAVGSGDVNDWAAINAALDAALDANGVLYFPPGRYRIDRPLLINRPSLERGIVIRGAGPNVSRLVGKGIQRALSLENTPDVHVADLGFSGAQTAVYGRYLHRVVIERCDVSEFGGGDAYAALHVDDSIDVQIRDCLVRSGSTSGILVARCQGATIGLNRVYGLTGPRGGAVVVAGAHADFDASDFLVHDNLIDSCVTYGVFVAAAGRDLKGGTVSGNRISRISRTGSVASGFKEANAYGVCLQGEEVEGAIHTVMDVSVRGNAISDCNTGVYVATHATHCSIMGNTISSCVKGTSGIQVGGIQLDYGASYNNVMGNCVRAVVQSGINVHNRCDFNNVVGNTIVGWEVSDEGQGDGIVIDAASRGCTIAENQCDQLSQAANANGIRLNDAPECRVTGNLVRRCHRSIRLEGSTTSTVVSGNTVLDNVNNAILKVGAVAGGWNIGG